MNIPIECLRRSSGRLANRTNKSAVEMDPDYSPAEPSKKKKTQAPKQLVRSKTIGSFRNRVPPSLNIIERPEYSVEDWRKRASEKQARQSLRGRPKKAKSETNENAKSESRRRSQRAIGQLSDLKKEVDEGNTSFKAFKNTSVESEDEEFDIANLPNFVMGTSAGIGNLPSGHEFKSLWRYELPELDSDSESHLLGLPSSPPNVDMEIMSVVACFSVGQTLDLKRLAKGTENVELNPDKFAPLVMRIKEPRSTGLIFRTGRIVVSGAKTEEDCKTAANIFVRKIRSVGYRADCLNYHVQNVSAKCNLNFRIRLPKLCLNKLYGNISYDPEVFPGLEIALEHPKVKVCVFYTGSIVMSGAKSMKELKVALGKVYPLIRMYAY